MAEIIIRAEQPYDGLTISDVVLRADANVAYSDHREHLTIERLHGTDAYRAALSLLAEIDREAVGHFLLSRAYILGARSFVATLALAPLLVVPEHQSCGVCKRRVSAAEQRAASLRFASSCSSASRHIIRSSVTRH